MILLTSSDYIKAHSGLNDNTYDKMILPALERAQDIDLSEVLGDCLVETMKTKVDDGTIDDSSNALYKVLLDNYIAPFLTYTVLSNLTLELGQVIGNAGINTVTDEHRQTLSFDERGQIKDYWLHIADAYRLKMVKFLKNNATAFPEWKDCCRERQENLSAACSIYLGGGKRRILL